MPAQDHPLKLRELKAGTRFLFLGLESEGEHEVLRNSGNILVRPVKGKPTSFPAFDSSSGTIGEVRFVRPASSFVVSGGSLVVLS